MDEYKYETIVSTFGTVLLWWCLATSVSLSNDRSSLPKTVARLEAGKPPTIVCLGDSVTGVYYHTGGRRAYPEMLQIAISKCYAGSPVSVINSGISGHTTADGIARLQEAVLDHEPDLVTLMYGLNDMTRLSPSTFRKNLVQIVEACQTADKSLVEIEADAQQVRSLCPDLVVVAIPWMPAQDDTTAFARTFGYWSARCTAASISLAITSKGFNGRSASA